MRIGTYNALIGDTTLYSASVTGALAAGVRHA